MTDWLKLPEAIAHVYGHVADTACTPEGGEITSWRHESLPLPTTEQLEQAIAEYEASLTAQPNWTLFRQSIVLSPAYQRVVASSPQNGVLNATLVWTIGQLMSDTSLLSDVAGLWGVMVGNVPLDSEEVAELQAIATTCQLPFTVDESGLMVAIASGAQ